MSSLSYTCQQDETRTQISYKMYGTIDGLKTLVEANPTIPLNAVIPMGTILIVPIIDNTDETVIKQNTAPWK